MIGAGLVASYRRVEVIWPGLSGLAAVGALRAVKDRASLVRDGCIAGSIVLTLVAGTYTSPLLPVAWSLLFFAAIAGRIQLTAVAPLVALAALTLLAIPLSGDRVYGTALMSLIAISAMPLFVIPAARTRVMALVSAFSGLNCIPILVGQLSGVSRPPGFSENVNATGGLMAVCVVWLLTTRYRMLAVPIAFATTLTESRQSIFVMLVGLGWIVLKRPELRTKLLSAMVPPLLLGSVIAFAGDDHTRAMPDRVVQDAQSRVRSGEAGSMSPWGQGAFPEMPHTLPAYLAIHVGLIGLVFWGWIVCRRLSASNGSERIVIVAAVLLGVWDYQIWAGPIAPLFWMLMGKATEPALARVPLAVGGPLTSRR